MDDASITELYRRFGPLVYRRCLRLLGDKEAARDATQQVFIKLLANPRRFEPLDEAIPWIQSLASNHCFNVLRDAKRRGAHLDGVAAVESTRVAAAPDAELLAKQVLARAEPLDQAIARGVLIAGKEQQEVAAELGVSDKTVQRRLKRFLDDARKFLSGGDS